MTDSLAIDELRLQLAEATAHITALELGAYRQQQQLDLLQAQLRKLYEQMRSGDMGDAAGAALSEDLRDEIPPHY